MEAAQTGNTRMSIVADFNAKYRPRRFSDVTGQELVADWCRRQVRSQTFQSIILGGPLGTGKTTLGLIYAKAHFCQFPQDDMSPCGECDACIAIGDGRGSSFVDFVLHECGEHGGVDDVLWFNDYGRRPPWDAERRVILLDESHALSPRAWDSLLKLLTVREKWGPTFILATTRPDKIPATVRSRVQEFSLELLSFEQSLGLIKSVCEREYIESSASGLELLAKIRSGYPRFLLRDLEQVASFGPVTEQTVRHALHLDFAERFGTIIRCLIVGDLKGLIQTIDQWPDEPSRKLEYINRFLSNVFFNESLHLDRSDPVIDVVSQEDCRRLSDHVKACAIRLGLESIRLWEDILQKLTPKEGVSHSTLVLRLTEFYHLLTRNSANAAVPIATKSHPPRTHTHTRLRLQTTPTRTTTNFLPLQKAETFYENGTFLPQIYGCLFNARITLKHDLLGITDQSYAEGLAGELMTGIREKLSYRLGRGKQNGLHYVYHHEFCDHSFITRIAVHVPEQYLIEMMAWASGKFLKLRGLPQDTQGVLVSTSLSRSKEKQLSFHWMCVKAQLRHLNPDDLERAPNNTLVPLIDLLGIPKRIRSSTSRSFIGQSFGRSESLEPDAHRAATKDNFGFLSAFNDRAWAHLYIGWELKEFEHRQNEMERRQAEEAKLRHRFPSDDEFSRARLVEAMSDLRASYPENPSARLRHWRGWWLPSDLKLVKDQACTS